MQEFLAFSTRELARWNRRVASIVGITRMRALSGRESATYLNELWLIRDELTTHAEAFERLAREHRGQIDRRSTADVRNVIARLHGLIEEGCRDLERRFRSLQPNGRR
jgi:hypothetical protein